jgi:hypothetical protein
MELSYISYRIEQWTGKQSRSERRQRFSFFRTSKLATPILFLTLELVKPQPTNLRIVQNYKQRKTILKKMELRARLTFDSSNN